jgi:hypothetical protein
MYGHHPLVKHEPEQNPTKIIFLFFLPNCAEDDTLPGSVFSDQRSTLNAFP